VLSDSVSVTFGSVFGVHAVITERIIASIKNIQRNFFIDSILSEHRRSRAVVKEDRAYRTAVLSNTVKFDPVNGSSNT